MNYLAIDTSSKDLAVTARVKGKVYSYYKENCQVSHSVLLNGAVESVLTQANANFSDIDVFACTLGAGSFTGIRIGISTTKAFSFATGKKVLGVTSFDVLAYNTQRKKTLALIGARNNNYYACIYENNVSKEPFFASEQEIRQIASEYEIVANEHISGLFDGKVDCLKGLMLAVEDKLDRAESDRESLVPLYVKKSQAEEI